jgi:hypothetical protein
LLYYRPGKYPLVRDDGTANNPEGMAAHSGRERAIVVD